MHLEPKRRLVLGIALIALVALQQFAELPFRNAFASSLSNSMHIAMFAGLTQLIYWAFPKIRFWQIALVIAAIALATEALQYLTGGNPSVVDLLRDGVGFAITTAIHHCLLRGTARIAVLVIVTSLVTLAAPSVNLYANYTKAQNFPQLFQPGGWPQSLHVVYKTAGTVTRSHSWTEYHGKPVVRLTLDRSSWPGIHFAEPYSDWHEFGTLIVDAFNPGSDEFPISVGLRHAPDHGTSRYDTRTLATGHNRLRFDLRKLAYRDDGSPATITHVLVYGYGKDAGQSLLLGNVWLE